MILPEKTLELKLKRRETLLGEREVVLVIVEVHHELLLHGLVLTEELKVVLGEDELNQVAGAVLIKRVDRVQLYCFITC